MQKRGFVVKLIIIICFIVFIVLAMKNLAPKNKSTNNFFIGSKNKLEDLISPELLNESTKTTLQNQSGIWAIAIKDLKKQKVFLYNAEAPMTSASLYKLTVMWAAYWGIENNQLNPNEVLESSRSNLDNLMEENNSESNSGEIISYTIENAIKPMITISDNYSALLLANKIGWGNIENLMAKEGINGISLKNSNLPTITASATLEILERIYKDEAVSKNSSEKMKTHLFNQQVNNRIPKYLPENIKVGHKTGELEKVRHDAGIILGNKSDYVFVFMTETEKPQETEEIIAKLSKQVFEELER